MGRPRKKTKKIDNSSPKIDHILPLDADKKKNTDLLPTDIVENILQRLPAKSIAKFVTVSKSWVNIIRSNYFINSFFKFQTQQQPHRLLFAMSQKLDFHWSFFSSSSDDEKPPLKFISRMTSKFNECSIEPVYVKGLVNFMFGRTQKNRTQIISNPSTGKSIVLPVIKGRILGRFFGFDPINCEYKVLCIMGPRYGGGSRIASRNQVLTVGFNGFWRKTELWIPHHPLSNGVCIDGILYYLAADTLHYEQILVRFDVRSEKFLKQSPCLFLKPFDTCLLNLINYNSRLAIAHKPNDQNSIDLWVLEDDERDEWLEISHDVSPWRSLITGYDIEILGTNRSGEIVYTCDGCDDMFYVIYQDHKKKDRFRIVDITLNLCCDYKRSMWRIDFIDYVESVMLL